MCVACVIVALLFFQIILVVLSSCCVLPPTFALLPPLSFWNSGETGLCSKETEDNISFPCPVRHDSHDSSHAFGWSKQHCLCPVNVPITSFQFFFQRYFFYPSFVLSPFIQCILPHQEVQTFVKELKCSIDYIPVIDLYCNTVRGVLFSSNDHFSLIIQLGFEAWSLSYFLRFQICFSHHIYMYSALWNNPLSWTSVPSLNSNSFQHEKYTWGFFVAILSSLQRL